MRRAALVLALLLTGCSSLSVEFGYGARVKVLEAELAQVKAELAALSVSAVHRDELRIAMLEAAIRVMQERIEKGGTP